MDWTQQQCGGEDRYQHRERQGDGCAARGSLRHHEPSCHHEGWLEQPEQRCNQDGRDGRARASPIKGTDSHRHI